MAIPYPNIARAVALRSNILSGGSSSDKETAYTTLDIESTQVTESSLSDDILATEREILERIADMPNSIYKSALLSDSANVATGGLVPEEDASNVEYIGGIQEVIDASDSTPLQEATLQEVLRANNNGFWVSNLYLFSISGSKIYHTRTNVKVSAIAYSQSTQNTAYGANGNSVIPQALEKFFIAKVLAELPQEKYFVPEGAYYRELVATKQDEILQGKEVAFNLPQIADKTASANPVKN